MAQSTYGTATLLGNFTEEQSTAPPLNGVLPNYGTTSYSTTSKAELTRPQKNRQYRPERNTRNKVHRLITQEYIEQMAVAGPAGASQRFSDVVERPNPNDGKDAVDKGMYETSMTSSFGARAKKKGRRATQLANQKDCGVKSGGVDKGPKAPRGAYGERLREHSDPMHDTRSQRSWVYGGASMFKEHQVNPSASARPKPREESTSLPLGGSSNRPQGNGTNRRSTTTITQARSTGIAKRGGGVWMD